MSQLLGAYFHQDSSSFYDSRDEALDEYVSATTPEERVQAGQELGELLTVVSSDQELETAARALGLDILPPQAMSLRQWLELVRNRVGTA
ncbi:contact-dependent growth inhibition system immunity protein [Streptomyces sp. NPDC047043]|uniref:contact-dependent growth inhibition system immunity protein n=1 Tax=Streptomyces sp. NPDC047043 TaxID=3154497 RepID=UPI0034107E32